MNKTTALAGALLVCVGIVTLVCHCRQAMNTADNAVAAAQTAETKTTPVQTETPAPVAAETKPATNGAVTHLDDGSVVIRERAKFAYAPANSQPSGKIITEAEFQQLYRRNTNNKSGGK
ncbi:MAG: hypothetical protein PHS62_03010 [Patescibacteria group bacterium]|nr:hypothetical protein [Patescibacteria group bacterium]